MHRERTTKMLNIAICDDIPVMRELLAAIIHEYEKENQIRFHIEQFDSGEQLLETYEKDIRYDLLFLDHHMKKLTGAETALAVRKHDKSCSIVFVTSCDTHQDFMKASPLQILQKPAGIEDIFQVLDQVLSDRRRQFFLTNEKWRLS